MSRRKNKLKRIIRRRKPKAAAAATGSDLIKQKLARVRPRPFDNEPVEDVALFDNTAFRSLKPEIADQVSLVKQSLALVSDSQGEAANRLLSGIPRTSPMSQWRLLVRGLVHWYADEWDAAEECWRRLDQQRRPGRIALALQMSRSNEKELAAESDSLLVAAAKLVRKICIDRPAIAEATLQTAKKERAVPGVKETVYLGSERLDWLRAFSADYRQMEPELVAALQRNAVERAAAQPFVDIFETAAKIFPGPAHDPLHTLLRSRYQDKFEEGAAISQQLFTRYIEKEVPQNERITETLRNAIQSVVALDQAREQLSSPQSQARQFGFFMAEPENRSGLDKLFSKAIKTYPANLAAHKEYTDWLQQKIDSEQYDEKADRKWAEKKIPAAMQAWSNALPESIDPRLWLVDHYLENEKLEEAKPHVEWLSQSRHADPRVRAIPWKWEMLEAMRLSRRKVWLPQAAEKLDEAEKVWPAWLSKDWLAYFRAALLLRSGDKESYEKERAKLIAKAASATNESSPFVDAVMMLGAAQRMRVPAADLKPLREPVDLAVKKPSQLSDIDLVLAGAFFYDLNRTSLVYPAYRMHGGKFLKEFSQRLKRVRTTPATIKTLPQFWGAVHWLADRRFLGDRYEFEVPRSLQPFRKEPQYAAAVIGAVLKLHQPSWKLDQFSSELNTLRNAMQDESDPYLRYWYTHLVEQATEEQFAASRQRSFNPFSDLFSRFAAFADDDDDEYDDDDDDYYDEDDLSNFDPRCNCPACTAARKRAAAAAAQGAFESELNEPWLDEDDDDIDNEGMFFEPPPVGRPKVEIPRDPELRRTRPKDPLGKKKKKKSK